MKNFDVVRQSSDILHMLVFDILVASLKDEVEPIYYYLEGNKMPVIF